MMKDSFLKSSEVRILKDIDENSTCSICHRVRLLSISPGCDHHFCEDCVKPECPKCHTLARHWDAGRKKNMLAFTSELHTALAHFTTFLGPTADVNDTSESGNCPKKKDAVENGHKEEARILSLDKTHPFQLSSTGAISQSSSSSGILDYASAKEGCEATGFVGSGAVKGVVPDTLVWDEDGESSRECPAAGGVGGKQPQQMQQKQKQKQQPMLSLTPGSASQAMSDDDENAPNGRSPALTNHGMLFQSRSGANGKEAERKRSGSSSARNRPGMLKFSKR